METVPPIMQVIHNQQESLRREQYSKHLLLEFKLAPIGRSCYHGINNRHTMINFPEMEKLDELVTLMMTLIPKLSNFLFMHDSNV